MFSGSIVALITPFTGENTIDYPCLGQLIEWHIESGTQAIVLAGTTGESPTLTDAEKIQLARFAVTRANGRIKIILGNGSNNTAHSVDLTLALNDTGIDGFLTVTPYYNKPTPAGLLAHFQAIIQASQLPIIIYNVPSRTQCDLSNELVATLSELNGIIGLKDATADLSRVSWMRKHCAPNFLLFSGDDATAMAYCLAGGDGVISVTANVAPCTVAQLQLAIKQTKLVKAQQLEQQLIALHRDLFIEANPIAVKWALFQLKKIPNANLRLPLVTLSVSGQQIINQTLLDSGLFDQEC
jgi:4-hydroxy-tetrahydrodipicolinate synthase